MAKFIDLTGRKFGRLTVLRRHSEGLLRKDGKSVARWVCECSCGSVVTPLVNSLMQGGTQSCGCLSRERHTTHGDTAGGKRSLTYRRWSAAKERCFNPNNKMARYYIGRGITMADRWRDDYAAFAADMGECPPGHTLERVDFDGNYEPGNCIWAPKSVQAKNRRTVLMIEYDGRRMCLADWARELGAPYETIRHQYRYQGKPFSEIAEYYAKGKRAA